MSPYKLITFLTLNHRLNDKAVFLCYYAIEMSGISAERKRYVNFFIYCFRQYVIDAIT